MIARAVDRRLLAGRRGRWQLRWAVLGTVLAVVGNIALTLLAVPLDALMAIPFGGPVPLEILLDNRPDTFAKWLTFAATLILPVIAVLAIVHGQSWRDALGPDRRFEWPLFWRAAGAFTVTLVCSTLILIAFQGPQQISLQPHPPSHAVWMLLAALVILPQAFAEDLAFKGYLLRIWGAVLPSRTLIVLIMSALFTSLHVGNSDMAVDLAFQVPTFFITWLISFAIYARTLSLGAATGMHWANNVVSFCILTSDPGGNNPFALFVYRDPVLSAGRSNATDPVSWLSLLAGSVLLWVLLTWPRSPFYLPPAKIATADPISISR